MLSAHSTPSMREWSWLPTSYLKLPKRPRDQMPASLSQGRAFSKTPSRARLGVGYPCSSRLHTLCSLEASLRLKDSHCSSLLAKFLLAGLYNRKPLDLHSGCLTLTSSTGIGSFEDDCTVHVMRQA